MNRDEATKRKIDALIKILEGEVMLLRENIDEGMHWDRPQYVRAPLLRIRTKIDSIAQAADVDLSIAVQESAS
jgi:hypothetical protein